MNVSLLNRMLVSSSIICAASLVGASVPTHAEQKPKQKPQQQEQRQPQQQEQKKPQQQVQQRQPQQQEQKKPQQQVQQRQPQVREQPQVQQKQPQVREQQQVQQKQPQVREQRQVQQKQPQVREQRQVQQRLPEQQQQVLVTQQRQRLVQYRDQLDQQERQAQQQVTQLQQQNRTAQYDFQVQYNAGLREQSQSIQAAASYNYGGDPFFYTAPSYRYAREGRYYETNDYGANVLRLAINQGYGQGFRSGRADRQDHWRYNYRSSYAYLDANYGYRGFYIERADYNYYFRQGFRRGYEDGYYSRRRYGLYATGQYTVNHAVLSLIINFRSLR